MKKQLLLILGLLLSISFFMASCKKDDNPSSSETIENSIKTTLDSVITNTHVPGLVAGIWAPNEGINLEYTAGVANLETNASLSTDMIFRIGSNTKTMTITVLLQLVDEGLINLNDKLSGYIPDFPMGDEVTIEMLTNMKSGIFNYSESELFVNEIFSNPTKFWTTEELLSYAITNPYYFDPGTGFHYSNSNTIIAGKIIEIVTGNSLESNIRTRLIETLNLENTAYLIGGTEIPGNHSSAYYLGEYDPDAPECSELFDISWGAAAGSAISKLSELKVYVEALTQGTFLSDTLQQHRLICHDIGDPHGRKYGMGIMEYKGYYGHNGALPGYTSLMMHSPELNCTIIIWYNSQINNSVPTDLLYVIPKLIYPDL